MSEKNTKGEDKGESKAGREQCCPDMCRDMMSRGLPDCCGAQMREMMSRFFAPPQKAETKAAE